MPIGGLVGTAADPPGPEVCVVHLVWVPLGTEPLKKFLLSYSTYRAGADHDLLMVFNGFKSEQELAEHKSLLSGYRYQSFLLWKSGLDIRSYFAVARNFHYKYFCFLNSYSRILDHEWLLKMYSHVVRRGVGIVGATGSWESFYTNFMNGLERIDAPGVITRLTKRWKQTVKMKKKKHRFGPFPNHHIRTNGFMIHREIMLKVRSGFILRKTDAYKFESGKNSLTKQVLKMGLDIVVVGRDGKGYGKEEWDESGTFRQSDQGNLLIADNQTDMYAVADSEMKSILSHRTWKAKHVPAHTKE